jgi:hypothetical protein
MPRLDLPRRAVRHAARALALAALLSVVSPAAAHAQFGKLIKKAAQGAMQGAAEGAAQNAAKNATGGERTREDAAVTITPQNLDLLLAALGPTAKAAQEEEAERTRYWAQQKKFEAHRACRDSIKSKYPVNPIAAQSPDKIKAMQDYSIKSGPLMERYAQALQSGDAQKAQVYADSAGAAGEQLELIYTPQLKACGAYVSAPTDESKGRHGGDDEAGRAPKVPAGMTATQFGRLREKVAAWLLTDGKYKVNDDERSALDARRKELDALTPLFRGNTLAWSSWGDLK